MIHTPFPVPLSRPPRGNVVSRSLFRPAASLLLCGGLLAATIAPGLSSSCQADDTLPIPQLCSHCHQLPDPGILPQSAWADTIWQMAALGGFGSNVPTPVDVEAVVSWYQESAPSQLPPPTACPIPPATARFRSPVAVVLPDTVAVPFVSNLLVADLLPAPGDELVTCDMRGGGVWLSSLSPEDAPPRKIADLQSPARAEAADLDRDGRMDLVVAVLGSSMAMDHLLGQIVWLRQTADGDFDAIVLAENLGRVADVQPSDIDGDGDLDLVVAEFGWRQTGHLLLFENDPEEDGSPSLKRVEVDGLHGASRVVPADLDNDGQLELVALYAQEHECVRVYHRTAEGWTTSHDLYRAPHPAWGHSSMQVADLDGDEDLDLVLTNGDAYDNALLKPFHGIHWLENLGDFTFAEHALLTMPGAYTAATADLDGDGDLDLVAAALAEPEQTATPLSSLASLVWLEQTAPGIFRTEVLETGDLRHPFLTLHDTTGDGLPEIVVGNGCFDDTAFTPADPCIRIWSNRGR